MENYQWVARTPKKKTNMEVRKIKRDSFSWGVWDLKAKTFVKVFETKEEAEDYLQSLKPAKKK